MGGLLVALVAVMIPITIVALLKLSRRDLSAMLEGAGWAINARMRLTRQQAEQFTNRPLVPGMVQRWFTSPLFLTVVGLVIVAVLLVMFEVIPSRGHGDKQATIKIEPVPIVQPVEVETKK